MVVCLARRTRELRLKLTINSPWETISGFNLTATKREKRPKCSLYFCYIALPGESLDYTAPMGVSPIVQP